MTIEVTIIIVVVIGAIIMASTNVIVKYLEYKKL